MAAQPAYAPAQVTTSAYRSAERFLGASKLVLHGSVLPTWIDKDDFWYKVVTRRGNEYILIDSSRHTRHPAFNHERLAAALSAATAEQYSAYELPISWFKYNEDRSAISFKEANNNKRAWTCDLGNYACTMESASPAAESNISQTRRPSTVRSPNGQRAVFIRDDNLWLLDVATQQERQLTMDGTQDYGYATNNSGWTKSDNPVVAWSPDSRKIATFKHDARQVGEMYLVETKVGHPILHRWKYPLPGDAHIFMIERVIINADSGKVTRLDIPPDPHRSTTCDHVVCGGKFADTQWSSDSSQLAFVSMSRDYQRAQLRVANAQTGKVRNILEERVDTFFESGNRAENWRFLPESNLVIWFSERSGWGHLYSHDLRTGVLQQAITHGSWDVLRILHVDIRNRTIYFEGSGREKDRNPYFRHLYKVSFDGGIVTALTPEDADHTIYLSPSGKYFVDTFSRPDVPPVSLLRQINGKPLLELERADISQLEALGWRPPMPVTVKAHDGTTDLYGLVFKPKALNPDLKYPIINKIYPGPQTGSVGRHNFSPHGALQALAELGFVVVALDGMGTPQRSKAFHSAYYGNMGENTLPDQIAGMQQLAQRYRWIDIERAGIYGHSGGGYAAAAAMFRYPDFFKVGIAQAGNHDNRNYEAAWGEKWHGLLTNNSDGGTNYDNQANQLSAGNLKGKLLLVHGLMDSNVPPYGTFLVVDALIKANRDFDLLLFPNSTHRLDGSYLTRRRWDYFVRYLLGAEPPQHYQIDIDP